MVGEIRDLETAEIAVQASLTGHLVMSTLHTNTAVGAITRLVDMGIEPFLLATSVVGVLAQRLVRVLCPDCKEKHEPDDVERNFLEEYGDIQQVFRSVGCDSCMHTGYRGRTGIYELLVVDDTMRELIHDKKSERDLNEYAHQQFRSIHKDGWLKVKAGTTSVQEVLRVTLDE